MNNKPLVSVIIPFFNTDRFIQEAIDSLLAQTYDSWELFLVDDGSTDRSTEIALRYANQYPEKIRYLEHAEHQNRGLNETINLGINKAQGEYIAVLDSDDVWLPSKLEQQVATMMSQPKADMVYGPALYWYSWTGKAEDLELDYVCQLGLEPNTLFEPPALFVPFFLRCEISPTPTPSTVMLRREVIERIGGFEEESQFIDAGLKYVKEFCNAYSDQIFYAKVCLNASVFATDQCLAKYRLGRSDSVVAVVNRAGRADAAHFFLLNWLREYLSKQGVKDIKIWKALRKAFWPYQHPHLYRLLRLPQRFVRQMTGLLKLIGRRRLSFSVRRWLWTQWHGQKHWPPVGWVRFGSLRQVTPISRYFGYDRGLPIDRYYIEGFLVRHVDDIRGRLLEIKDSAYTRRFGGDRVTKSDVLDIEESNLLATIVADLTHSDDIPSDTFDCFILTQTLQHIYDVRLALQTIYRILKPGGVLLATFPGISQISNDPWADSWYWSFTTLSAQRLFAEFFPEPNIKVEGFGNVLAATAFLQGLAAGELSPEELDYRDQNYEVLITVRAMKPEVTR